MDNNKILPSLNELLQLEVLARQKGSGIEIDSLIGIWKFKSVWKKVVNKEDTFSSRILSLLDANLEIRKPSGEEETMNFAIGNSIKFGRMALRFTGRGDLMGLQPLLSFSFDKIEIVFDSQILFNHELSKPEGSKRPFFALIGMCPSSQWLAARGRGGGLALWLKDE